MPEALTTSTVEPVVRRPDHGRDLRLDIEGMRAIAVGSVLAFHSGLTWFAGGFVGVDVFFVLSGFLITGLLAREVSRTGRVRLGAFWARRVKRLLPASATVLAFSALVTWIYLPITQRSAFGGDIVSAALYAVNWRLAGRSVDYLAEDVGASPVQHYWSLSVEEQFYLVWPLLILLVAIIWARRWRRGAFITLSTVTVLSFAWSVAQSHSSPQTAFFVSTTRIWELGIGALLALAATRVGRFPTALRAAAGWIGILAIAYAVLFFDGSTTWPGVNTLVPTVGAALMIASGIAPTPGSPQRLLSLAPMVWIGGLSYSLYLWHWPILIAAQAHFANLQVRYAVLLMLFSVVPAWLCHKYIENPIRFGKAFKPTRRALGLGAALTAVGIGIGFTLSASASIGGVVREATPTEALGARALLDKAYADVVWSDIASVKDMRPLATEAVLDRPPLYDDNPGCQVAGGVSKPKLCEFGDTSADRTIVIVGDSKIVQWETALSDLGKREGWKLVQITKSACAFTDAYVASGDTAQCRAWGKAALQEILKMKPDLVIASHHKGVARLKLSTTPPSTEAVMADGMASYWRTLTAAGIPTVTLLDNPGPPNQPVYECVAQHPKDLSQCAFSRTVGYQNSGAPAQRAAAAKVPGVKVIDMSDTICPDGDRCAAVIGNVLVYRQGSHLTRTYIDSAETQLAAKLYEVTGGSFGAR
jgi:peptidoglycan/LPS O-acetylase OafA/YrhL